MIDEIKKRCGIAEGIDVYNDEIEHYIEDCKSELAASGVPESVINAEGRELVTAITFYVKANIGNDRSDTDKYMKLFRRKVIRLTLEDE